MENKNGNLNWSTDEVHNLLHDELNETIDGWLTTPQFLDDKELELLIMSNIGHLKKKKKQKIVNWKNSLYLSKIH